MSETPFEVPFLRDVGGFRLIRKIGDGGFGDVYEAERDGKRFAVKLFRNELADFVDAERYRREVKTLQIDDVHLANRCRTRAAGLCARQPSANACRRTGASCSTPSHD